MPIHPKTILYSAFKGLNNNNEPENTDPNYLKKVLNINVDKTGNLSKRKGYSKVDSGSFTSLWASTSGLGCYGVRNGDLVKIDNNYSFRTIKSGVSVNQFSFEEVDGIIYLTSKSLSGMIINDNYKDLGIPINCTAPTLLPTAGILPAGIYQVAFTYMRSDGIESGVNITSVISVGTNSGINALTTPLPNEDIITCKIYCSNQNGTELYYAGSCSPGSTYTIGSTASLINPLRMFNLDKPPLGTIIKYYKGIMYFVEDNILWYSEPYQYQHINKSSNYIEFPSEILEVMPVEDGIWIASDKLYFLSGKSPNSFEQLIKEHIKVVKGTATKVPGSYFTLVDSPSEYKWLVSSDLGIFMLANQGYSKNLTVTNVALDPADSGTSLFLQDQGINQYLSILKTNQNPNNSVMGDLVTTSIVRNGITLP